MREDAASTIRYRLQERIAASGKSMHSVSKAIGANPGYVRDLLDPAKTSVPSADRLAALARELETTVDYLIGRGTVADQVSSEVGISDRHIDWKGPDPTEPGIPLVGTGDCADIELSDGGGHMVAIERSSFDPEYHVRMIARPPALRGTPGLYAIYFHGESMIPRFEPGDVGIVDPTRPPRPGEYVLVQLTNGSEDEVISVLVKRLVRATSSELLLEQFNPAVVFSVPRGRVARYHRILQQTDLLL